MDQHMVPVTIDNVKKNTLIKIGKILGISFQTKLPIDETLKIKGKTKLSSVSDTTVDGTR